MNKLVMAVIPAVVLIFGSTAKAEDALVVNGGFETPSVTGWQLIPSGSSGLGWAVEEAGSPNPASLEIQRDTLNPAYEGHQYAELDSDRSIKIFQNISTTKDYLYELKYAWSPRPGLTTNSMKVSWNGQQIALHSKAGDMMTDWNREKKIVKALGSGTRLEFAETGPSDGLGMFLDAVSLEGIDKDKDGINDGIDNCVHKYKPGQIDSDKDGTGDVCEVKEVKEIMDNKDKNLKRNCADVNLKEGTKACYLYEKGVNGKGIFHAPGLQKPFHFNFGIKH